MNSSNYELRIVRICGCGTGFHYTAITMHKYRGIQFNYRNKEIGHIHGNGMVDILLHRKTKKQLISKNMVKEHHVYKKSGWISMYVKDKSDIQKVISVLQMKVS